VSEAYTPRPMSLGLLPEPERNTTSFVISSCINLAILALLLILGLTAKHVIQQHYEATTLVVPDNAPPKPKVKPPDPVKLPPPPEAPKLALSEPKIVVPQNKPEPKPVQMEAKVALPQMQAKPQVVTLAPQPKSALTAAMPAQNTSVKASTAPVHLGQTFGVMPNPNATRPANVAAIGNPYGGMNGTVGAPHGVVGSTGIGNGTKSGSNAGVVGKVASAGIPGGTGTSPVASYGKVASAGIPQQTAAAVVQRPAATVVTTNLEVLSKPSVQYTSEARQLRVQGDVVLRVTFTSQGQVVVLGVVRGLGHGLDEEARRVASGIRFRPATRNGQPVDTTTTITISFQLA